MMNNVGSWGGGSAWIHVFGGILGISFLVGLIFFVAWAIKTIKREQLLHWAVFLVAVSVIGWILMASLIGFSLRNQGFGNNSIQGRGAGMMWGSYGSSR
jgi:hypothetical protein